MGTGWRRAFCRSIHKYPESTESSSPLPSPTSSIKTGCSHSTTNSTPSTPKLQSQSISASSATTLRCRTTAGASSAPCSTQNSPKLLRKTTTAPSSSSSSSPRSPSRFSLLKTTFRSSKNSCGICEQSTRTGQGTAIFTAECSHSFHFPCIAEHVRKHSILVCPVCHANWQEIPLLVLHKNQKPHQEQQEDYAVRNRKEDFKAKTSVYDDDEPLSSPIGNYTGFNTIPEADNENGDEEEEKEIQEFQGFFADSNLSSSSSSKSCGEKSPRTIRSEDYYGGLRNVEVKLLPVAAVISIGRKTETFALAMKIKAPPLPVNLDPNRRAPIDLVTVLDLSETLTREKLQMLKRSMRLVISSLGSSDRLSIIAFSSSSKRLLPMRRMTVLGQKSAKRIIDRLIIGQGLNSGEDALRKATKVLEDRRERNPVECIILLSDNQEDRNSENQSRSSQYESKTRFSHLEIPVINQKPSEDAFAKCVRGLLSVVVQDLRIKIGFSSDSSPAEIAAIYSCTGKPRLLGSNSIRIVELYAEEEREFLVELKVPVTNIGAHHVMKLRCCFRDPATQEVIGGNDQTLLVPKLRAVRSSSSSKIERLRNLFIITRAIVEARRLIEHNNLSSAYRLLSSTRDLMRKSSSILPDSEYLQQLETELTQLKTRRLDHHRDQHIERRTCIVDENVESTTPISAWRAAEKLAKLAILRKSMNRVGDLHGFEDARF